MKRVILSYERVDLILTRICHELVEQHQDFENSAIVSLQPRGIFFGKAIHNRLKSLFDIQCNYGELDCTFYRDDFRRNDEILLPNTMDLDFPVEDKHIILIDDVLFTGRSIRASMDAINDYGRPATLDLVTLIDRKFNREVPIQPDYVGEEVDTRTKDYVKVEWKKNKCQVWIITDEE